MEYINKVYTGRLNRRTYLVASIVLSLFYGFSVTLLNTIFGRGSAISGLLTFVIIIAFAVIGVSFSARRFHDLGKSGWLVLIMLIPVVGFFAWLYLIFKGGDDGSNSFGAQPKDEFEFNKAFGLKK